MGYRFFPLLLEHLLKYRSKARSFVDDSPQLCNYCGVSHDGEDLAHESQEI